MDTLKERLALKLTSGRLVCLGLIVGTLCLAFLYLVYSGRDPVTCSNLMTTLIALAGGLAGSYATNGTRDDGGGK